MKITNKGKSSYSKWILGLLVMLLTTVIACTSTKNKTVSKDAHEGHDHTKYYQITLKKGVNPKLIEKDFGMFDARNLGKSSKSQEIFKYSFNIDHGQEAKFRDQLTNHPGIADFEQVVENSNGAATQGKGTKGGKVKIQ